jgi:hypothetical protein
MFERFNIALPAKLNYGLNGTGTSTTTTAPPATP